MVPNLKVSDDYLVYLPSPDCDDEIIPTPPLVPEVNLRFSQRNAQGNWEDMVVKAANVAKKKNLEGITPNPRTNSFAVLGDAELICRANKMGVLIPNDDFACINILHEMEMRGVIWWINKTI